MGLNRYAFKKCVEVKNATPTAMEAFTMKLQSLNITVQLDLNKNASPINNFKLFINRFTNLKQQCILMKTVRYNMKVYKDD